MARYVRIENGSIVKYPYNRSDFEAEFRNVSLPPEPTAGQLMLFGVYIVAETPMPAYDPQYDVSEGAPVEVSPDVWSQTWTQTPVFAEELSKRLLEARYEGDRTATKADAFIDTFIAMTPQEVEDYIEVNVTNIASAKTVLKKMAKMMLFQARREFS